MDPTDWRTVESNIIFPNCREVCLNLRGHLLSDDFQEFLNLSLTLQGKKYDCPKHSAISLSASWRVHFHSRTFSTEQLIYLSMASAQIHPLVAVLRCHICSGEYSSSPNFSMLVWSQTAMIAIFNVWNVFSQCCVQPRRVVALWRVSSFLSHPTAAKSLKYICTSSATRNKEKNMVCRSYKSGARAASKNSEGIGWVFFPFHHCSYNLTWHPTW